MRRLLIIGFAVLAAALNAVAAVLQRVAGSREPDHRSFSPRLMLSLLVRPVWMAGVLTLLLGFVAQAVALTSGGMAKVQILLVAELPFALLLGAAVFGGRPRRAEWLSIVAMTAGLAVFLICLAPQGSDPLTTPLWAWALGLTVCAALVGLSVILGRARLRHRRAALLGIATGCVFGVDAALTAAIGAATRHGAAAIFTTWQTYALLILAPVAFFLLQNALQAGSLVASQPGFTLANPVVSVGWGVMIFGEQVRGGWWLAGSLAGAALIAAGTVLLVRSPLLSGQQQPSRDDEPATA